MAGVDISTQFSTGVDYTTAFNNGWLLKDAAGNYMTGYGSYLGDVGSAAYQQRWADNVGNFLAQTGANGVYIDDVLSNISTWSDCGCFPAKYPSQAAWQNAMVSWVASIGPALKARGFQVVASAHAFIPGDLRSNDGSLEVAWWRQLAPYLTGLSTEYWSQNPANPSQIRTTGAQWYQQWDNWQQLVSVAQNAGVDFFGLTYGSASTPGLMRYARGSFLLDWHGRGGAVSFEPKDGSDPWNPAATTDIGLPAGSKVQIAPGVWQRQYSAGIVVVNTNGYAVTSRSREPPARSPPPTRYSSRPRQITERQARAGGERASLSPADSMPRPRGARAAEVSASAAGGRRPRASPGSAASRRPSRPRRPPRRRPRRAGSGSPSRR